MWLCCGPGSEGGAWSGQGVGMVDMASHRWTWCCNALRCLLTSHRLVIVVLVTLSILRAAFYVHIIHYWDLVRPWIRPYYDGFAIDCPVCKCSSLPGSALGYASQVRPMIDRHPTSTTHTSQSRRRSHVNLIARPACQRVCRTRCLDNWGEQGCTLTPFATGTANNLPPGPGRSTGMHLCNQRLQACALGSLLGNTQGTHNTTTRIHGQLLLCRLCGCCETMCV